ncbi:hypothetical protein J9978_05895 [Chromobacterium violaceum]|uniref:hypothetical protein n=1 Tax=Chromobacterium violaceum TaxID=536 RepID=UPI001B33D949|nr:hypothetical protein [Chromobacterium violaceum]MBP4049031.1 hypothetical protein [Chromobacterium violaceum]
MYQIDNASAATSLPAISNPGTPGFFTDGNPATGQAPTIVPAEWLNTVMMELSNAVSASGQTPTKGQLNQLARAIQMQAAPFILDTGSANAYVTPLPVVVTARTEGQIIRFKAKATNTGASTINDGLGVVPLVGGAHQPLQGGEIIANGDAWAQWNSSVGASGSYILLECTGGALQVGNATQGYHAANLGQLTSLLNNKANTATTLAGYGITDSYTTAQANNNFASKLAVQNGSLNYVVDTGTQNAYVCNYTPAVTQLVDGQVLRFRAASTNTGSATLTVNGLGPYTIQGGNLLQGGEIINGSIVEVAFTTLGGGFFYLLPVPGAALQVANGVGSQQAVAMIQVQGGIGSTNSWQRFPSGMIKMNGSVTVAANGTVVVQLPKVLSNGYTSIIVTAMSTTANAGAYPIGGGAAIDNTSFTLKSYYSFSSLLFAWEVVGS